MPLGATVPLTCDGRLAASQSAPTKRLARSRGCVVPSRVLPSQPWLPTLRRTMLALSASPHLSVNDADASGHD
ncbi:MAG: hypothetical protein ACXVCV_15955 [Polyangia bacterium]